MEGTVHLTTPRPSIVGQCKQLVQYIQKNGIFLASSSLAVMVPW